MRLLNAWTFEIKEFMGSDSEIYAMLSHTWETEEVTFADFRASSVIFPVGFNKEEPWLENKIPGPAGSMNGFKKIIGHCEKARMEGYDWIWIDTCCIDKSSSAELSEAINSMFHWYENAGVCYVYLSDVKSDEIPALADSSFRKSRWFTRGWTLQELIAPQEVVFLAADWEEIGSRWELSQIMSEITNIDEKVLKDPSRTVEFSSAQRMSWASMRKTTRIEDQAYSLLGIFNVQMPLLYGEGSNAFKRLQIEVLNSSNDSSLLAWEGDRELHNIYDPTRYVPRDWLESGLLAKSVEMFWNAGSILRIQQNWLEDTSLHRSGIYIKADNQTIDYNGPIYGPLDPRGAHLGGLSKVLSPDLSRSLIRNSRKRKSLDHPKETPLEEFVDDIHRRVWSNICIALVGKLASNIDVYQYETTSQSPQPVFYIAILLQRTPGQPIIRLHWPLLLIVDLTNTQELQTWPLTLVNAVIDTSQKPTVDYSSYDQYFLTGPKEYSLTEMDGCETLRFGCYRMQYNPARIPCRIRGPFCMLWNFLEDHCLHSQHLRSTSRRGIASADQDPPMQDLPSEWARTEEETTGIWSRQRVGSSMANAAFSH